MLKNEKEEGKRQENMIFDMVFRKNFTGITFRVGKNVIIVLPPRLQSSHITHHLFFAEGPSTQHTH